MFPRVWKQVEKRYAAGVPQGQFWVGTLGGYRAIENGRADALEGAELMLSGELWSDDPTDLPALRRLGFRDGGGQNLIQGDIVHRQVEEVFVLCFSDVGCTHDPDPATPKITFEVSDVELLADWLTGVNGDQFAGYIVAPVTYMDREFFASDFRPRPPPALVKPPQFAVEREVRILFKPTMGAVVAPFITRPSPEIARLIREFR